MSEEKQLLSGEEGTQTDVSSIHQPQDKPASTTFEVNADKTVKTAEAIENQKVNEKSEDKNASPVLSIKDNSASQLVSESVILSGKEEDEDKNNTHHESGEAKQQDKDEKCMDKEDAQNAIRKEADAFKDIMFDESQENDQLVQDLEAAKGSESNRNVASKEKDSELENSSKGNKIRKYCFSLAGIKAASKECLPRIEIKKAATECFSPIKKIKFRTLPAIAGKQFVSYGLPALDAIGISVISFSQLLAALSLLRLARFSADHPIAPWENIFWSAVALGGLGIYAVGVAENTKKEKEDNEEEERDPRKHSFLPKIGGGMCSLTEAIIFFGNAAATFNQYGLRISDFPGWMGTAIGFALFLGAQYWVMDVKNLCHWVDHGHRYPHYDELLVGKRYWRWLFKFLHYAVPLMSALCFTALGTAEGYQLFQALFSYVFSFVVASRAAWPFAVTLGATYGTGRFGFHGGKFRKWLGKIAIEKFEKDPEFVAIKSKAQQAIRDEELTRFEWFKRFILIHFARVVGIVNVPLLFLFISVGGLGELTQSLVNGFPPPTAVNPEGSENHFMVPYWLLALFFVHSLASTTESYAAEGRLLEKPCYTPEEINYHKALHKRFNDSSDERKKYEAGQAKVEKKIYFDQSHTLMMSFIMGVMFSAAFGIRWGMSTHDRYLTPGNDRLSTFILDVFSLGVIALYLYERHTRHAETTTVPQLGQGPFVGAVVPFNYRKLKIFLLSLLGSLWSVGMLQLGVKTSRYLLFNGIADEENLPHAFTAAESIGALLFGIGGVMACAATSKMTSLIKSSKTLGEIVAAARKAWSGKQDQPDPAAAVRDQNDAEAEDIQAHVSMP